MKTTTTECEFRCPQRRLTKTFLSLRVVSRNLLGPSFKVGNRKSPFPHSGPSLLNGMLVIFVLLVVMRYISNVEEALHYNMNANNDLKIHNFLLQGLPET